MKWPFSQYNKRKENLKKKENVQERWKWETRRRDVNKMIKMMINDGITPLTPHQQTLNNQKKEDSQNRIKKYISKKKRFSRSELFNKLIVR